MIKENINQLTCTVQVKNPSGLHTRPAAAIVKLLRHSKSDVRFTHRKETVNAKSILSLLMLAARQHSKIKITVEGTDAIETLDKLKKAFDSGFEGI